MSNNIYQPVAIRLFTNPHFGKWIGAGRKNPTIFNCSMELPGYRHPKLWVDLVQLDHLASSTDPEMIDLITDLATAIAIKLGIQEGCEQDILVGQTKLVSPHKFVEGLVVLNVRTREILVVLCDGEWQLQSNVEMTISPCRRQDGKNSPDYLASNYDLDTGHRPAALNSDRMAEIKSMLNGAV